MSKVMAHIDENNELHKYKSPLSTRYCSKEMQYAFSEIKKFSTWRTLWFWLAKAEKEAGASKQNVGVKQKKQPQKVMLAAQQFNIEEQQMQRSMHHHRESYNGLQTRSLAATEKDYKPVATAFEELKLQLPEQWFVHYPPPPPPFTAYPTLQSVHQPSVWHPGWTNTTVQYTQQGMPTNQLTAWTMKNLYSNK